jgi:AraC-like DNA-binding protein
VQLAERSSRRFRLTDEGRCSIVTEVGLMLGFAETSLFTTSFRRSVGLTPSDFRRSIL